MRALRRVLGAPGLILAVVAVQLLAAAAVGSVVRVAVGAAMGRWSIVADGHLLGAVFELLVDHPGALATARELLAGSAVLALVTWTAIAAGVLRRLDGPARLSELAAAAVGGFPGVLVVTLWHLLPRAVLLALVGMVTKQLLGAQAWGLLGIALTVAALGYAACALDLARAAVVLHGAPRFHPWTALGGYLRAARCPGVLLPSMLLSAGQWAAVAAIVAVGIAGMGSPGAIWLARALSVVATILGLTRMAVAVEAGPEPVGAKAVGAKAASGDSSPTPAEPTHRINVT